MLEQRVKGLYWIFSAMLVLANVGLYLLILWLEKTYRFFGLNISERIFIYLIVIPVAVYYSLPLLRRVFQHLPSPGIWNSLTRGFRITIVQTGVLFGVYFLMKDVGSSRLFLLSYLASSYVLNCLLIYFGPSLLSLLFYRQRKSLRAVLYGFGNLPEELRQYISRVKSMGINFIGYYTDQPMQLRGVEWLGNTDELLTCEGGRKRVRADVVFAFTDESRNPAFKDGIERCLRRGARVQIYSNLSNAFLDPVRVVSDGTMQFLTFFEEPLQNPVNLFLKRISDILISLPVVIFVLPPLTALVWVVQRIQSPGPLLFKQTRYGMNRRPFVILKYRTMHVHDRKHEAKQATKGDSRIFAFGKFLRKTSLDEFPQFINALRGNMSVVGPRPHLTLHDDLFEKYYKRYRSRHYVKPGITGLAQVSGYRGEAAREEDIIGRVRFDIQYISSWSLSTELYIILKTIWQMLFPPKSAY